VVGAIRGDQVEVRPGEFVGAVTALIQRGMVRMVRSRVVTATASQPDVWNRRPRDFLAIPRRVIHGPRASAQVRNWSRVRPVV
jgi:hypothetical protein